MEEIVRRQAIDLHTSQGVGNSTPDNCLYNFADTGTLTPNYPAESSMELAITSVCLPNAITAVQTYNSTCFITSSTGLNIPVILPQVNFKGLAGMAALFKQQLVAATSVAWDVSADSQTNTIAITAPANLIGSYTLSFNDKVVNNLTYPVYASSCRLLGFRQRDTVTFTANTSQRSTVPCQASGASLLYIATDLYSLDACTVDLFGTTRRATVLAKLQIVDAPWTVSTYQDSLTTFRLKLPAYNISQFSVFLLNEYMQPPNLKIDWSMSGVCTYYSPSPLLKLDQKLDEVLQTLKYIWLQQKHNGDDQKKIERQRLKALHNLEIIQGRSVQG